MQNIENEDITICHFSMYFVFYSFSGVHLQPKPAAFMPCCLSWPTGCQHPIKSRVSIPVEGSDLEGDWLLAHPAVSGVPGI